MPSPTTAGAECDICDSPIGPEEGPAGNGECHSASGHEVVCDRCMDTLSAAWLDYIEGRGPRPEGLMPHERQTPSPECAECERLVESMTFAEEREAETIGEQLHAHRASHRASLSSGQCIDGCGCYHRVPRDCRGDCCEACDAGSVI